MKQGFMANARSVRCNTKVKADRLLKALKKQERWYSYRFPKLETCVYADKTEYYVWYTDKLNNNILF